MLERIPKNHQAAIKKAFEWLDAGVGFCLVAFYLLIILTLIGGIFASLVMGKGWAALGCFSILLIFMKIVKEFDHDSI